MIVMCAWCNSHQGQKEPLENTAVTHGMCDNCFREMSQELQSQPPLPKAMDAEFFETLYAELIPDSPAI
jgi:hypothetical protein